MLFRKLSLMAPALAVALVPILAGHAMALEAALIAGLRKLDPGARLEQRCDIEAMSRIDKDKTGYRPERVVAGATADTVVDGDTLKGPGAALRSKGKWYKLSFTCKTSPDHMDVLSFDYKIGDVIPQSEWEKYELWD